MRYLKLIFAYLFIVSFSSFTSLSAQPDAAVVLNFVKNMGDYVGSYRDSIAEALDLPDHLFDKLFKNVLSFGMAVKHARTVTGHKGLDNFCVKYSFGLGLYYSYSALLDEMHRFWRVYAAQSTRYKDNELYEMISQTEKRLSKLKANYEQLSRDIVEPKEYWLPSDIFAHQKDSLCPNSTLKLDQSAMERMPDYMSYKFLYTNETIGKFYRSMLYYTYTLMQLINERYSIYSKPLSLEFVFAFLIKKVFLSAWVLHHDTSESVVSSSIYPLCLVKSIVLYNLAFGKKIVLQELIYRLFNSGFAYPPEEYPDEITKISEELAWVKRLYYQQTGDTDYLVEQKGAGL